MAISDYDTLALDYKGKPTNGVFKSRESGASVEIYKNWLYVRDPKSWVENAYFTNPTMMQVHSGALTYKDISIIASRGKENEIRCIVTTSKYNEKRKPTINRMIGIGVYGWKSRIKEYLEEHEGLKNVNEKEWENIGISKGNSEGWDEFELLTKIDPKKCEPVKDKNGNKIEYKVRKDFELTVWTGVTKEMINSLKRWVSSELQINRIFNEDEYKWFHSIDWSNLVRFNQGDAFFAENLKFNVPASKVGESDKPILTKAIDNMSR